MRFAVRIRRILLICCLSVGWLLAGDRRDALAGGFRCGNRLVLRGYSALEVLGRCGDPAFRSTSTELVTFRIPSGELVTTVVPIETWTYNRGPHEFLRYVVIRDGVVDDIYMGSYGF
jgi:hypothetical protein